MPKVLITAGLALALLCGSPAAAAQRTLHCVVVFDEEPVAGAHIEMREADDSLPLAQACRSAEDLPRQLCHYGMPRFYLAADPEWGPAARTSKMKKESTRPLLTAFGACISRGFEALTDCSPFAWD